MKTCTRCKQEKSKSDFPVDMQKKSGVYPECKICVNKKSRDYYARNKIFVLKRVFDYRIKNKDKVVEWAARWYRNNKERIFKNNVKNRIKNRVKINSYMRRWRSINIEKARLATKNSGAKRRFAKSYSIVSQTQWINIKNSYDNACFYCKSKNFKLTMDHYVPLSRGGKHCLENIVPACQPCNSRKWALLPEEFLSRIKKNA